MHFKNIKKYSLLIAGLALCACNKGWLDVKRDLSLTVPGSLDDMRALLNNSVLRNDFLALAEISADEYEINEATFNLLGPKEKNAYLWNADIYEGARVVEEWDNAYKQVFQCNVVLEGLTNIHPATAEQHTWNGLQGEALFFRAKAFFNLAQLYAAPYDAERAGQLPGIPLRLSADVNARTVRAGMQETYDRILQDLQSAARLLGVQAAGTYQPAKPAAYAALARCYLNMGQFERAGLYADSAFQLKNTLLDFNGIPTTPTYPIAPFNPEVLLPSTLSPLDLVFFPNYSATPETQTAIYAPFDLRKQLFFTTMNGHLSFRGSYMGSNQLFQGSSTAEMLLIRAECSARAGHTVSALDDLNHLLQKRYKTEHFSPLLAGNSEEALGLVLRERRRELVRRGLRWQDLRRLNQEPERAVTLTRSFAGQNYTLPPNSPRYTLPIPDYVIRLSGISQNERL